MSSLARWRWGALLCLSTANPPYSLWISIFFNYVQGIRCDLFTKINCNFKYMKFALKKSQLLFCFVLVLPLHELRSHSLCQEAEPLVLCTYTFHCTVRSHSFFSSDAEKILIVAKLEINKIFKHLPAIILKKSFDGDKNWEYKRPSHAFSVPFWQNFCLN